MKKTSKARRRASTPNEMATGRMILSLLSVEEGDEELESNGEMLLAVEEASELEEVELDEEVPVVLGIVDVEVDEEMEEEEVVDVVLATEANEIDVEVVLGTRVLLVESTAGGVVAIVDGMTVAVEETGTEIRSVSVAKDVEGSRKTLDSSVDDAVVRVSTTGLAVVDTSTASVSEAVVALQGVYRPLLNVVVASFPTTTVAVSCLPTMAVGSPG